MLWSLQPNREPCPDTARSSGHYSPTQNPVRIEPDHLVTTAKHRTLSGYSRIIWSLQPNTELCPDTARSCGHYSQTQNPVWIQPDPVFTTAKHCAQSGYSQFHSTALSLSSEPPQYQCTMYFLCLLNLHQISQLKFCKHFSSPRYSLYGCCKFKICYLEIF